MAKNEVPAVAGFNPIEVEPYVDKAFKPIEVTPYEPVGAPAEAPAKADTKSPDAGEKKEN